MAYYSNMLWICVGLSLFVGLYAECSSEYVHNLRQYRVVALHGRFTVPRDSLEAILQSFKETNLDDDVELTVPPARPAGAYDDTLYGEIIIADMNLEEMRHSGTVRDDHRSLLVTTPFQSGDTHGMLVLGEITDSHTTLTSPMIPNRNISIEVESVDVECGPEQTVTYRTRDGDMFRLTVCYDAMCDREGHVGEDYSAVMGVPILSMASTGDFDWGCGPLDHDDFCGKLNEHHSKLQEAGANVCVGHSATDSRRCTATVRIDEITGIFLQNFPYLGVNLPRVSFESEFLDRGHHAGIKFPCLC